MKQTNAILRWSGNIKAQRQADLAYARLKPKRQAIQFGKYKGKRLDEIPADYLAWACGVKTKKKSFRKFQRLARDELKRRTDVRTHNL